MSKKLVGISFKRLQLKSLVETTGNPQVMTDAEFKGMVKSIKKDGWLLDAAVCWKRPDGKHQIISGHHRVKAAIEAGLIDADIKVIEGIDEKQARLLVLEANQRKGAFDFKIFNDFVDDIINKFNIEKNDIFDDIGVIFEKGTNDIDSLWEGMPEYINKDKTGYQDIIIHFENKKAIDDFQKLIKQKITGDTKYIWFPKCKIDKVKNLKAEIK